MDTTKKLTFEERVRELTPVDVDQEYKDLLDEIYSFDSVGGPFQHMSPARVLEEVDPTAFRCGLGEWLDSESDRLEEIAGDYYLRDEIEEIRDAIAAGE